MGKLQESMPRPTLWFERNYLRNAGADASPYRKGVALIVELGSKKPNLSKCFNWVRGGADLSACFSDDPTTPVDAAGRLGHQPLVDAMLAQEAAAIAAQFANPPAPAQDERIAVMAPVKLRFKL